MGDSAISHAELAVPTHSTLTHQQVETCSKQIAAGAIIDSKTNCE